MIDIPRMLELLGLDATKKGDEWWACCPNHKEKTGSWSMRDQPGHDRHGSFKCFGCNWKGGPILLVAKCYDISYASARNWMVKHGLDLEEGVPLNVEVKVKSVRRCFKPPRTIRSAGDIDRWVTPARRYTRSRGISRLQVQRYGLAFVADGRLRNRIIFPFCDVQDVMLSYSARSFDGRMPKYLTPDAKERPNLSSVFGAQHWPDKGERRQLVVCEGAINALACERAGARHIGALDGSSLHPGQVLRLATFDEVIVCTDPDYAGNQAADALQVLSRWCTLKRAIFPEGTDAAMLPRDELRRVLFGESVDSNRVDVPRGTRQSTRRGARGV